MANYSKIKRVEPLQSHITMAEKEKWNLEKWEGIEEIEKGKEKLRREAAKRLDEDNALKGNMTQDRCLYLQPSKRLETHLLYKGGFQE